MSRIGGASLSDAPSYVPTSTLRAGVVLSVFTVHWSPVSRADNGEELFALWPAPMNDDVCFRAAGFTDFGDADEAWDADANRVLDRLLSILSGYGQPNLISKPVERSQSWLRSLFRQAEVYGLREQIELPIQWDELPDCVIAFGESGITLRAGKGHHIFWISVPAECAMKFSNVAQQVAGSHPLLRTDLRWDRLL